MSQLCARPVEITADNDSFTVNYDAGGATGYTIDLGGHACFLTVLKQIKTAVEAECNPTGSVYLTPDLKVYADAGGGHTVAIVFTDELLGVLLGFNTDTLAAQQTHEATYTPSYLWRPGKQSLNQERWEPNHEEEGAFATGQSGRIAGVLKPGRDGRPFTWDMEAATNISEEAATLAFTIGANTYYPEIERNWKTFVRQARAAMPTDSGNPNLKGFYYFPDDEPFTGAVPTVAIPATMDSGGIRYELAASPDRFTFCSPDVNGSARPRPGIQVRRDWYRVEMDFTTATAPTWNAP